MRRALPIITIYLAVAAGVGGSAAAVAACLPNGQPNWPLVESVLDVACVIQNAFLPNEAELARICRIAPEAMPLARRIVGEHRAGVKQAFARAGVRAPVGGYREVLEADAGVLDAAGGAP